MFGFLALALLLLPVAVAILLVMGRRRSARLGSDSAPYTLIATRFIAIAYAVLTFAFTIASAITTLVSDAVEVSLPVGLFWPEPHPWITIDGGPTASVTAGGFSVADVTVDGLGMDARLLLASGHAAQGLTFTIIALVVALLCHRILGGMPFRPVLSRSINLAAGAIAVGGILWQVFFGLGGSIASAQVLTVNGWQSHELSAEDPDALTGFDPLTTGLPDPTFALSIEFWPLMLGLALVAIAAAFQYGERLQRETEGLI